MIYRKYSLFSSTLLIWGGVATAGLAGIFILHGKWKHPRYHEEKMQRGCGISLQYPAGEVSGASEPQRYSLRQQDRAMMANAKRD